MDVPALNYLGEFKDINLEKEFFQQDMAKEMRNIKPVTLVFGLFNTMFLIPDYFLVRDFKTFNLIVISRLVFLLLVVVFYTRIDRIKDYRELAEWLTVFEAFCVITFLFVFSEYKSPNFLIQAFGVIVILVVVFMIPNRWIYMLAVSLSVSTAFILFSLYFIPDLKISEFSAGIVYIFILTVLCGIISYRFNYFKRVQYASSKELIRMSVTDSLTGACNRVKFDEELKYWIEYSNRYNTPLSLIILDFDDFKRINDTLGHLVGDSVIIECASLINSGIRDSDIFARWGGDEFVILLPNTDRENAIDLSQRLRKKIEEYTFKKAGLVTCSFGISQLCSGDSAQSLLQKADQMLYTAKNAGKNAVRG